MFSSGELKVWPYIFSNFSAHLTASSKVLSSFSRHLPLRFGSRIPAMKVANFMNSLPSSSPSLKALSARSSSRLAYSSTGSRAFCVYLRSSSLFLCRCSVGITSCLRLCTNSSGVISCVHVEVMRSTFLRRGLISISGKISYANSRPSFFCLHGRM